MNNLSMTLIDIT